MNSCQKTHSFTHFKCWTHHHHRFKVCFPCLHGLDCCLQQPLVVSCKNASTSAQTRPLGWGVFNETPYI